MKTVASNRTSSSSQGWLPPFGGNMETAPNDPMSQIWTEKWCKSPPPCMSLDWSWTSIARLVWVGIGKPENWNSVCPKTSAASDTDVMSEPEVVELRSLLCCSIWASNLDMFAFLLSSCSLAAACSDSWRSFLVFRNLPPDPLGLLRAWTCRDSWRYGCCSKKKTEMSKWEAFVCCVDKILLPSSLWLVCSEPQAWHVAAVSSWLRDTASHWQRLAQSQWSPLVAELDQEPYPPFGDCMPAKESEETWDLMKIMSWQGIMKLIHCIHLLVPVEDKLQLINHQIVDQHSEKRN